MENMAKSIELVIVNFKGRKITSVGNCPHCKSPIEYIGIGKLTDGYMKGTGFKGHKGVCVKCKSDFSITN